MKKNKILLNALVISAGALILTGCGTVKLKNGEKVAISVNGGNITSDSFYKTLRNKYGKSILVDEIDKKIFNEIYKDNKEIESQVDNQLEYIKKQYSDDFEGTLKSAGYDSEDALKDELRLNYQRDKAVSDYVKEVVGDISAKHILIKVKSDDDEDGLSDKEALKKAKDIIKKLDKGEDFDKLAKENSDDEGSKEKGGDLGYFNKGDMVEEFENAAYDLKVSEYTKEPVKTQFGYHVILKTDVMETNKSENCKRKLNFAGVAIMAGLIVLGIFIAKGLGSIARQDEYITVKALPSVR